MRIVPREVSATTVHRAETGHSGMTGRHAATATDSVDAMTVHREVIAPTAEIDLSVTTGRHAATARDSVDATTAHPGETATTSEDAMTAHPEETVRSVMTARHGLPVPRGAPVHARQVAPAGRPMVGAHPPVRASALLAVTETDGHPVNVTG